MILLAVLVFVAAEVAAFVVVAEHIGFLLALALLIVVSALGPLVVGRAGLGVLAHTRDRLRRGEPPTRELLDGLVVLLAGAFVCVPGFIGDALGLVLLIEPVRRVVIRFAGHRLARRVSATGGGRWRLVVDACSRGAGAPGPRPSRARRPPPGEAREITGGDPPTRG